jgi:hypothetical protein
MHICMRRGIDIDSHSHGQLLVLCFAVCWWNGVTWHGMAWYDTVARCLDTRIGVRWPDLFLPGEWILLARRNQ